MPPSALKLTFSIFTLMVSAAERAKISCISVLADRVIKNTI